MLVQDLVIKSHVKGRTQGEGCLWGLEEGVCLLLKCVPTHWELRPFSAGTGPSWVPGIGRRRYEQSRAHTGDFNAAQGAIATKEPLGETVLQSSIIEKRCIMGAIANAAANTGPHQAAHTSCPNTLYANSERGSCQAVTPVFGS